MRFLGTIIGGLHDVFADVRVRSLIVFTLALIASATLLFWMIEGWTLLDSAFFAVVTISTVGYGNLTPVTVPGKILTIVYILIGLGVFVAAASAVAEALIRRNDQSRDEGDDE